MERICPNPMPWNEAYNRLTDYAKSHLCEPPLPPKPLILAGWVYSNDIEKKARWDDTVRWAERNGCIELISNIPNNDYYFVNKPTTYTIGPMGGPMYRSWDFEEKSCPSPETLDKSLKVLFERWTEIVGADLSNYTRPISFTGKKARRLLIKADIEYSPPWGGWTYLSNIESERRAFTQFRSAINDAISPHEIDHIDFITDDIEEQKIQEQIKNKEDI